MLLSIILHVYYNRCKTSCLRKALQESLVGGSEEEGLMSRDQEPICECLYGWGQTAALYQDHFSVDGTSYPLSDLTYVEPIYRRIIGISSIRLKLCFKHRMIVLRGLIDSQPVRYMIACLREIIGSPTVAPITLPALSMPLDHQFVFSQGSFWDYSGSAKDAATSDPACTDQPFPGASLYQPFLPCVIPSCDFPVPSQERDDHGMTQDIDMTKGMQRVLPSHILTGQNTTDACKLYGEFVLPEVVYVPEYYEVCVYGFSVESLVSQLRQGQLPSIEVPFRLFLGETAHYCTDAALCEAPVESLLTEEFAHWSPARYRIKDRGLLVLTSRRLLYLGRQRQMLLGYEQIIHISHWYDYLALTIEHVQKRQLFEMRRALECLIYLEHLLQRYWHTYRASAREATQSLSPPCVLAE
jgi:hypothetical protein